MWSVIILLSMCVTFFIPFFLSSLLPDPILQVLQCLSGQGLTSSGGSGQVGSDGGNSSGASRTAVKERSARYADYFFNMFSCTISEALSILFCFPTVLSGSGLSICYLRRSIKSNVAGPFQIPSCGNR
jgi:hypothetical protein